jgi:hypothetical protein
VIFDETTPYPHDVFECVGDEKIEESIFADEKIRGFDGGENDPLHSSVLSPEPITAFTLEAEPPQVTTSFTSAVEASQVEGEIISKSGAPSHI